MILISVGFSWLQKKQTIIYPFYWINKVDMVAASGPSAKASEEDQERTRRLADAEMHRHHLESLLDQRDREITALREVTISLSTVIFELSWNILCHLLSGCKIWCFISVCNKCHLIQQELHRRYEGTPESTKTKALQTVIDMKVGMWYYVHVICLVVLFITVDLSPWTPRMQKSTQWSAAWGTWRRSC